MTKERLFSICSIEALILILIAVSIGGCGKPSNEKLAEIIKSSPQKGMVLMGPQFKIEKFNSVDVISVHGSDTDLKSVMSSNTVSMMDPTAIQQMLHAVDKKALFVRCNVTAKVVPIVTLSAPLVLPPISPELSLQKKTAIWTVVRPKDGEWICEMVLGVEAAKQE